MSIKPIQVRDLMGGLSLAENSSLQDNQFSTLTNFFYNSEKRLQKRFGKKLFLSIPDAAIIYEPMDSITSYTASEDAVSLALESSDHARGSGALSFDVTVATSANNQAVLTNSSVSTKNISSAKGSANFYIWLPSGAKTDLVDVRLKIGSGASGNYEFTWTVSELGNEAEWLLLSKDFSSATTNGTPNDGSCNYIQIILNYGAGYTDKTGVMVDYCYLKSNTYTKPVKSLYEYIPPSDNLSRLFMNVGTVMYEYQVGADTLIPIKTGLTEDSQFSFMAYKEVVYMSNGADNYMSYDLKGVSEHTGANTYKAKYLMLANDVGFAFGDPSVPSTLAYTSASPSNIQTFGNALVLDNDSSDGVGTGILALESLIVAGKERRIYKVDVATPSSTQIDYSGGIGAFRSIERVENDVLFLNQVGELYSLGQREGTTGSLRALSLSEPIKALSQQLKNLNLANAVYVPSLKNYYLFVDSTGDGICDETLVYSILTKSWARYSGISANDALVFYGNSDSNQSKLLIADPYSGKINQIETGLSDDDSSYTALLKTKNFDLGYPEVFKDFEHVDVFGSMNEIEVVTCRVYVDDELVVDTTIEGADYVGASGGYALDTNPLDTVPLDGDGGSQVTTMYPFKARIPIYQTGTKIQIELETQTSGGSFVLDKFTIYPNSEPIDIFPIDLIY